LVLAIAAGGVALAAEPIEASDRATDAHSRMFSIIGYS
jgi:hypothetical protein